MTRLIRTLGRKSEEAGFAPTLFWVLAWMVFGTAIARIGAGPLAETSLLLATVFVLVLGVAVGIGGLIGFWLLMDHANFFRRGYRIRWLNASTWAYEERGAEGSIHVLEFSRDTVGDWYPAPCVVHILSERRWEREAPNWARGRREEILERIADLFGANAGGRVQFEDGS